MSEHVVSARTYIAIWLTLLVLTGLTAGIAFIDLGPFNTVVALVIATFKALLVALIFMHVKYTNERMVKVVVISALFFLLLLLGLSLADYTTRLNASNFCSQCLGRAIVVSGAVGRCLARISSAVSRTGDPR